jgi:predicted O-linked N-acetylglucosamine transferase (SPINDLY family)
LEIDIAVDLMGYTRHSRPGILGHRPAPIQVSYLGFPGTMGAGFIDYVIADEVVAPFADQPHFSESIVHLPDSYWVNDRDRAVSDKTPTRAEVGLPAEGFVFCCFNQSAKVTPAIFEVWMRLLHRVENSVLWLFQGNEAVVANLRREAGERGIVPSRLVFARRLPIEQHLARHRLADLFLDTLPCNAHTTAVDALWVGLPVLTCRGEAFAARVAASLLGAVGLPELIAGNLEDYEDLAMRLATEPSMLSEIRARLERNRLTTPLFDTDRFRRSIEAAYSEMWEIWQRGEAPHAFAVPSPVDIGEPPPPRRRRVSLRARPRRPTARTLPPRSRSG